MLEQVLQLHVQRSRHTVECAATNGSAGSRRCRYARSNTVATAVAATVTTDASTPKGAAAEPVRAADTGQKVSSGGLAGTRQTENAFGGEVPAKVQANGQPPTVAHQVRGGQERSSYEERAEGEQREAVVGQVGERKQERRCDDSRPSAEPGGGDAEQNCPEQNFLDDRVECMSARGLTRLPPPCPVTCSAPAAHSSAQTTATSAPPSTAPNTTSASADRRASSVALRRSIMWMKPR